MERPYPPLPEGFEYGCALHKTISVGDLHLQHQPGRPDQEGGVMPVKSTKTARGFRLDEFEDRYGEKCSLQESSLASEAAIWFGTEGGVQRMRPNGGGWEVFSAEEFAQEFGYPGLEHHVLVRSRMHLTQDMVRDLLPALQHFAETGHLPPQED